MNLIEMLFGYFIAFLLAGGWVPILFYIYAFLMEDPFKAGPNYSLRDAFKESMRRRQAKKKKET